MSARVQRKLTTILAADAVGYSRAMEADEVKTLDQLRSARRVFSGFIERHEGRIVNTAGDGLIAEFPSVVEAVQCAIEVQQELSVANTKGGLQFRIGIHLGDVMIDGADLLGEGVNLAARLESMAEPGGVLISRQVYDQVQHKLSIGFEYLGEKRPKNFADDVSVYRLSLDGGRKFPSWPKLDRGPSQQVGASPTIGQNLGERVFRRARLMASLWLVLLVIDLSTGSPFWAHWPGLVIATIIGVEAAPLLSLRWLKLHYVRTAIVVAALFLINLFTWSGYLWVLWPAGALFVVELIRRLGIRPS